MLMNNGKKQTVSLFRTILNFPTAILNRLAWRFGKVDRYEVTSETITLHHGLFCVHSIRVSEIRSWTVYPEMGFDVVRIELDGNEGLTWIDKYNDLLAALRQLASSKEISNGSDAATQTSAEKG